MFIYFLLSKVETWMKCAFVCFLIWRFQWQTQICDKIQKKLLKTHIRLGKFHENVIFKKLKTNCINLWHTCYLGVLRGAELKSAVCPAQKWLVSHTNWKIQDGRHRRAKIKIRKCLYLFLLSMVEIWMKCAFVCFLIWGIQCYTQKFNTMNTHYKKAKLLK